MAITGDVLDARRVIGALFTGVGGRIQGHCH